MVGFLTPLSQVRRIGPRFAEKFERLGIKTVKDLLWHFPSRYEDFSNIKKIRDLLEGDAVTVQGTIEEVKVRRTWRRRMFIIEAKVADETGSIKAVWFNQRFLLAMLKKGKMVNLAGKVVADKERGLVLQRPIHELVTNDQPPMTNDRNPRTKHTGRLVPIYPETRRVTSKMIRYVGASILEDLRLIEESLPQEILEKKRLPEINAALRTIHFPENQAQANAARHRFTFEDLFLLQLAHIKERQALRSSRAQEVHIDAALLTSFLRHLPFELTPSQRRSLEEALRDMAQPFPMNRLLQGDVGSGKTIVAAVAALAVAAENLQSAFMAPTEVLARQHYETFKKFFPFFEQGVALLLSKEARIFYGDGLEDAIKKTELVKKIARGEVAVIIGTHALIQKSVRFAKLALVVIDEQHRFGVNQRKALVARTNMDATRTGTDKVEDVERIIYGFGNPQESVSSPSKSMPLPHFLSMSATPIPRTLSLTVFGDLDLSIIDELPKGRKEIITKVVAPANRDKAYAFIRGQVHRGRQAFVICPRIEPTDVSTNRESFSNLRIAELQKLETKTVKEEFEKLSKKVFPDLKVGMLHGKLKAKEKEEVMRRFSASGGSASGGMNDDIDILVSTSVVEVGVDVPNATIMMIEGAERFGLAQLYQFRGRVGRGEHQSFCFLFTDSAGKATQDRLSALLTAKNGFELAEKDLEIRGPGEFLGQAQTGRPDLAMKAMANPRLLLEARTAAEELISEDPELKAYPRLRERLDQFEKEIHLE